MSTKTSETKKKIIEAAIELFEKEPVEEVSISEICKKAGVSSTAFYYNFKNKETLLNETVLYGQEQISSKELLTELLACKNYWEQIFVLHTMLTASSVKFGPDLIRHFYISEIKNKDLWSHSEGFAEIADMLADVISKAQNAGEIKNTSDPMELAVSAMQLIEALSVYRSVYPEEVEVYSYYRKKLETIYDVREDLRCKD